jgi:hypothetical protein
VIKALGNGRISVSGLIGGTGVETVASLQVNGTEDSTASGYTYLNFGAQGIFKLDFTMDLASGDMSLVYISYVEGSSALEE